MFFEITSMWQILGWFLAFAGLIICNELARSTKVGGIVFFLGIPGALTIYFIVVNVLAHFGIWTDNPTVTNMGSWFHYAKLYAATVGCIGFMMIKYGWGIGKKEWFKPFPFIIVAINILIAVASDFESAIKGAQEAAIAGDDSYRWWLSKEGIFLYGGWWNWVNGIAGIINIACMTGWWGIYTSKDKKDMLWPDMTWVYILAYDVWNFEYTYNCLPNHAWYCGLALLLAPTVANALWNKGGWIQNRANTLAIWCMFAQVIPMFQDSSVFTTYSSVYGSGFGYEQMQAAVSAGNMNAFHGLNGCGDGTMQGVIAVAALLVNVIALMAILTRAIKTKTNPYRHEIFKDQKDFELAAARILVEDATESK